MARRCARKPRRVHNSVRRPLDNVVAVVDVDSVDIGQLSTGERRGPIIFVRCTTFDHGEFESGF